MLPDRKASGASSVLSLSAARKVDSRASASGMAQGSPRWSAPPAARVFAQDQARPVERAGEDPGRLRARALGGLDLDRAPLLPDHAAASVATSVTMTIASSSAAPRLRAWRRAALRMLRLTAPLRRERDVARQRCRSRPLPSREARAPGARRSAAAALRRTALAGRRRARRRLADAVAARLRVAPGVAAVEVDLPARRRRRARAAGRPRCPATAGCAASCSCSVAGWS